MRLCLATALAIALTYFPYRLLDGSSAQKAEQLRLQHQKTLELTHALAAENDRLRREIEALKSDPSAIIDIARDELGMVRKDELIIRIIEEEP